MGELVLEIGYACLVAGDELFLFVGVEAQNASHLDLEQAPHVVVGHFAQQFRLPRLEAEVDMCYSLVV